MKSQCEIAAIFANVNVPLGLQKSVQQFFYKIFLKIANPSCQSLLEEIGHQNKSIESAAREVLLKGKAQYG